MGETGQSIISLERPTSKDLDDDIVHNLAHTPH